MEKKKYSSYAQIEHDLEILKVEKEIHYQKMLLSIEKRKKVFFLLKQFLLLALFMRTCFREVLVRF